MVVVGWQHPTVTIAVIVIVGKREGWAKSNSRGCQIGREGGEDLSLTKGPFNLNESHPPKILHFAFLIHAFYFSSWLIPLFLRFLTNI